MTGQVSVHLCGAQPVQDVWVELVGELAADLDYLTGAAIVSQGPGHLLISHGLAVTFALPPALSQFLLVL